MTTTRRSRGTLLPLAAALLLLSTALPATAGPPCDQPCAHVADCPKVTCECAEATGSGVAACDTDETHCCLTPSAACERFCEVNNQTWTGRFTPEAAHQGSAPATTDTKDAGASVAAAPCDEPCKEPKDCRAVSCKCTRGTALDVAACDVKTHCCGGARVVCEHFCEKKGKWTGKLVDAAPAPPLGSLLDAPSEEDLGVEDHD